MEDRISCAYCGGLIPPRPDPRGRRAKYCSDACRAAASRERANKRHAEELEAAHQQATLDMRTPEQMLADLRTELLIIEKIIRDRGEIPEAAAPVIAAAQAVATAAQSVTMSVQDVTAPPSPALNRQQRRASKKRAGGKKR